MHDFHNLRKDKEFDGITDTSAEVKQIVDTFLYQM